MDDIPTIKIQNWNAPERNHIKTNRYLNEMKQTVFIFRVEVSK